MVEVKTIKTQELNIFAEISSLYLDDTVVGQDAKGRMKVLADNVDPIGRIGGGEYVSFGEVINVPRPK